MVLLIIFRMVLLTSLLLEFLVNVLEGNWTRAANPVWYGEN